MTVTIRSSCLQATIDPLGAELQSLRDAAGRDWLWDGDPAIWTGRAPLLFPIVGTLAHDMLRVSGREYRLPRHGFARRSTFGLLSQSESTVVFRLTASDDTRAVYPFDFVLDMRFNVAGRELEMVATVTNPGDTPLPTSFGYHPALRWPLPGAAARDSHAILFDSPEPAPIRRLDADGLIARESIETPVDGDRLPLSDELFGSDALIFDHLISRGLTYGSPDGATARIDFPDMPYLGLWTKPGAGYLCIEPWQGYSDPAGFTGDFFDKPGIAVIQPGASRDFTMRIEIAPATSRA